MTPDALFGKPPLRGRLSRIASARTGARALLVAALMWAPVLSQAMPQAHAAKPVVTMGDGRQGCSLRGTFHAAVSGALAWDVLSDYDHIDEFVSSVRSSRVEHRDADDVLLRQDAVGGFFLFHRHVQVLLKVHETPRSRIDFRDILRKDFHDYVGSWHIAPDSAGTQVNYELKAEPKTPMPRSVCRGMLKGVAQDLLEEVQAEMLRRAHLGSARVEE